jgi:hypothetical protein
VEISDCSEDCSVDCARKEWYVKEKRKIWTFSATVVKNYVYAHIRFVSEVQQLFMKRVLLVDAVLQSVS